jgi:pilus assembly protein CpaE
MKEHFGQPPKTRSARRLLRAWFRRNDGVAALEFALFAPILFFGLLATVDVGFALHERMTIDHVLRAGAQSAMQDGGKATVLKVLQDTKDNDPILAGHPLDLAVDRVFACPESPEDTSETLPTCDGSVAPYVYYELSAEKDYDGIFLPIQIGRYQLLDLKLGSAAQVQVR